MAFSLLSFVMLWQIDGNYYSLWECLALLLAFGSPLWKKEEEKKEEVLAVIDTTQGDIANIKLLREAYDLNLLDAKNLWEHIKPSVLESMDFSNVKEIVDYSQGDIANIKIIKDYYKIDLKTAKELWDSIREQENQ